MLIQVSIIIAFIDSGVDSVARFLLHENERTRQSHSTATAEQQDKWAENMTSAARVQSVWGETETAREKVTDEKKRQSSRRVEEEEEEKQREVCHRGQCYTDHANQPTALRLSQPVSSPLLSSSTLSLVYS